MAKNLHNETNVITKQDTTFLAEVTLEFFMAPIGKHTLVSWRRRFHRFNLEPKSSACFFDGFKSWTI
jgi:hypothetical protein